MTGHAQLKLTRTAGFSLDVAFDIPEDGVTAMELLKAADAALYAAKRSKRALHTSP